MSSTNAAGQAFVEVIVDLTRPIPPSAVLPTSMRPTKNGLMPLNRTGSLDTERLYHGTGGHDFSY